MVWLLKDWRALLSVLAVVALVAAGIALRGVMDKPVIAAAKADASAARSVTSAVQGARRVEHQVAASDAAASAQYQKGLEDGKNQLQDSLDRLAAAIRLRDQQLATARAGHLPAASAGAGRRDASAPADFLATHGADAERLAAEADDVVKQLNACQALVRADQEASAAQ
jgi:hypothetical protein